MTCNRKRLKTVCSCQQRETVTAKVIENAALASLVFYLRLLNGSELRVFSRLLAVYGACGLAACARA